MSDRSVQRTHAEIGNESVLHMTGARSFSPRGDRGTDSTFGSVSPEPRHHRVPHNDVDRQPYFVSTRVKGGKKLFSGTVAECPVDILRAQRNERSFLLLAHCFMPDHAHLVVVAATNDGIEWTMKIIKGSIGRAVNSVSGASGSIWQSGFFDKVPRTVEELNEYIRYAHDNPVVAGIAHVANDYPYSSAVDAVCTDDYRHFLELAEGDRYALGPSPITDNARTKAPRSEPNESYSASRSRGQTRSPSAESADTETPHGIR